MTLTAQKVGWLADASKAAIPQRPAAGSVHGMPFRAEKAEIVFFTPAKGQTSDHRTYALKLRQGKGFFADKSFEITLTVKQTLEGASFRVHPGSIFDQPGAIKQGNSFYSAIQGVSMDYKEPGKTLPTMEFGTDYKSKLDRHYTLRLLFGRSKQGKLPGQVYLCMPDAQKSFVAGTFIATFNK
jgi:hypothetical protein